MESLEPSSAAKARPPERGADVDYGVGRQLKAGGHQQSCPPVDAILAECCPLPTAPGFAPFG